MRVRDSVRRSTPQTQADGQFRDGREKVLVRPTTDGPQQVGNNVSGTLQILEVWHPMTYNQNLTHPAPGSLDPITQCSSFFSWRRGLARPLTPSRRVGLCTRRNYKSSLYQHSHCGIHPRPKNRQMGAPTLTRTAWMARKRSKPGKAYHMGFHGIVSLETSGRRK